MTVGGMTTKKFNPGFLTDDEIVGSFCVRTREFESIIDSLRDLGVNSSTHSLVVGPRGSGKTHLLRRVAAEVRCDPELEGLFPVVFAEESYEVTSCGEFWLECLGHLAEQAPDERDSLRRTYEELRSVADDRILAERCLGSLLDFADRHAKRLLLLVENMNMLFSDMLDPDAGWRLRKTLQTEPRIVLLASATSRFEEIDDPDHALFDLFRVIGLRPLDTDGCRALWQSVSGEPPTARAVRPLEILTGGNARLLVIIARFGGGRSFRTLMNNLLDLVDDHTEYFKSHLESLPTQERRAYLALARLWRPALAREIADLARLDSSSCSALLARLVRRGAVVIEGGSERQRRYYLAERLYNIYYLLRRGSGSDRLVGALVDFMICLYSPSDLAALVRDICREAAQQDILLEHVPEQMATALIREARSLEGAGREAEALALYDNLVDSPMTAGLVRIDLQVAMALMEKARLLAKAGQWDECRAASDDLLQRFGSCEEPAFLIVLAVASFLNGAALLALGGKQAATDALAQCLQFMQTANTPEFGPLEDIVRSLMLTSAGQTREALRVVDDMMERYDISREPGNIGVISSVVLVKAQILEEMDLVLEEEDVLLLMRCVASTEDLRPGAIHVITRFAARVSMARTLELIREAHAEESLLPLVVALRQELGETPLVAREVEEVSADIRRELGEERAKPMREQVAVRSMTEAAQSDSQEPGSRQPSGGGP